jgi:RimJ/RimL family protein N-acetyltransferase/SAM-dependent methyltransferase
VKEVRLSDGVLTLRPLHPADLDVHIEALDAEQMGWLWEPGDPEKYARRTPEEQRAGHLAYLEECWRTFGPGPKWVFAADVPGQPYAVYVDCDLANPHVPHGQANISYTTHKDHRGKGWATRAVRLACAFLREHTRASEAHIVVDPANTSSVRVAEGVGATCRGTYVDQHGKTMLRFVIALGPDGVVRSNRRSWDDAAQKYVRESEQLLAEARQHASLLPRERSVLAPLLQAAPDVVHLMSGHGLDDVDLVDAGAARVTGVDFSEVTAAAAAGRATAIGLPCRYVVGEVPSAPLADGCADLVYTGKGALIWLPHLTAWARDVWRLLRPGGSLFVYEAHPAVPLWSWDAHQAEVRPDRSYFARSHVNDSFPGRGATEFQHTLAEIVSAVVDVGLELKHLSEHPEPFWHPEGFGADAWNGRLPNTFMLLAERPSAR